MIEKLITNTGCWKPLILITEMVPSAQNLDGCYQMKPQIYSFWLFLCIVVAKKSKNSKKMGLFRSNSRLFDITCSYCQKMRIFNLKQKTPFLILTWKNFRFKKFLVVWKALGHGHIGSKEKLFLPLNLEGQHAVLSTWSKPLK